jgi:hypothetical protein
MGDDPQGYADDRQPTWRNVAVTVLGTVLGLASFFTVLILMLSALNDGKSTVDLEDPSALVPIEKIRQLRTEDQRQLTTYELIDKEQGVWRIPIEVAIDRLVAENQTAAGEPE